MKFKIYSRDNIENACRSGMLKDCVVISIADTHATNANINAKDVLFLHFDDAEPKFGDANCMTKQDAAAIVQFVNEWKNNTDAIVVNCHGGCCRSAAVCAAIKLALTGNDWDIFRDPRYCPNMHCYEMTSRAFGVWDETLANEKETMSEIAGIRQRAEDDDLLDDVFRVIEVKAENEMERQLFVQFEGHVFDMMLINDNGRFNWHYINCERPKNGSELEDRVFAAIVQ